MLSCVINSSAMGVETLGRQPALQQLNIETCWVALVEVSLLQLKPKETKERNMKCSRSQLTVLLGVGPQI
jgi:hypothetical protein